MDFFLKGMNGDGSDCPFDMRDIQRCPFLRNIDEPTNFSFASTKFSIPVRGATGPIFEDGPSFDMAFKLFHGKDGIVPLSERSDLRNGNKEADSMPVFNPLAGKAASISLSSFGLGGPFNFGDFSEKWKKQKNSESSNKKEYSSQIYNFRPIGDIESMESNSIVDVIAVVTAISPTTSIMRKNGTETQKRSLQLKDMSGRSVELTLWGSFCNTEGQKLQNICDSGAFPILVVKSARVNDFNGKSIGTIATSQLLVEPDFPEAFTLREWFDQEGRNVPRQSIFRESSSFGKSEVWKTISQIKDEKLGTSEKPSWISICASVSFVKVDNFCYTACPIMIGDRKCNKKVTINGDGKWRCVRCDKSVDACDYRYLLQMQIHDHTGMTWVTAFQEGGEIIMGMPAKDLHFLKFEEQDEEKFAEIIRKVLFTKYVFKLKVKEETFNDEARVKSTVLKAEKVVNFASESKSLLDLIDKLQSEIAEGAPINSAINTTGQATPPVYNPINSNTNTGRDYGTPANQVSQYGNQHSSSFASSGAPGSYISCSNCGGSDHSSAQCLHLRNPPEQSAGGAYVNTVSGGSGCASGNCYKCQQPGHWANNCPNMRAAPQSHGNSNAGQGRYGNSQNQSAGEAYANKVSGGSGGASGNCYRWQHIGHWARDCPARVNDFNGKSVGTKFDKVDNFCNTNMLIGIIGGFGFGILLLSTFLCFC